MAEYNLKKISKEIEMLNDRLLGIDNKLEKKIIEYQKEYEKLLIDIDFDEKSKKLISNSSNFNKAQSINAVKKLKLKKIAEEHVKNYDEIPQYQEDFNKNIGITLNLNYKNATVVNLAKTLDFDGLMQTGYQLDNYIKHELVNLIALEAKTKDAIKDLSKKLLGSAEKSGQLARYATTYIRTSLFGLSRIIDHKAYEPLNPKKYVYVGVIFDSKIRPFCAQRVGKTFTVEEIAMFPEQNGSFLDPYFAPGGYNCRHRLIPVLSLK